MSGELIKALFKRKSEVDTGGQTWESAPTKSNADAATHLSGLIFGARPAQEWLQQLEPTPEEDMLLEAVVEGFAERRENLPGHVPSDAKDGEALRQVSEQLAELRRVLDDERRNLGAEREELTARAEELQRREVALEECKNYPQPSWLDNVTGTLNIGVVGNAGVGKSLLINKIRRVRPHGNGWAPVGVNETTLEAKPYAFPGQPGVRLWDLPGAGTAAVPSGTYVRDMGLRYFDKVLICTAGRFTSMEVQLRAELERHDVPYCMVRTKADIDVWNNREDNGLSEEQTIEFIRADLAMHHEKSWSTYLVSSRDTDSHDMPKLVQDIFPGLKRQMDAAAPAFCPGQPAWNDAWAMPVVRSAALSGIQGRWNDNCQSVYLVQGQQVHVTATGQQCAVAEVTESRDGRVWWCGRWSVDEAAVQKARWRAELRWLPVHPSDPELSWFWSE